MGIQFLLTLKPLAACLADVGHAACTVFEMHVPPQRRPCREGQVACCALRHWLGVSVDSFHVLAELLAAGEPLQAHRAQKLGPVFQLHVVLQPLLRLCLEPALGTLKVQGCVHRLPALSPSLTGLLHCRDVFAHREGDLLVVFARVKVFQLHVHNQPLPAVVQPLTLRTLQRLLRLVAFQRRPPTFPARPRRR